MSKNLKSYDKAFMIGLSIKKNSLGSKLKYNSIPEWDSIAHMNLISELESIFKISIDTDDIVDFSSYEKGKKILKKYKIQL
jgi:acyl carrier protein